MQACSSTQRPTATIRPALLEQRDEVVRLHQPAAGAAPADQRLDARRDHPPQVERGLVDEEELARGRARRAGPSPASIWRWTTSCMPDSNITQRFLPSHLARCMAISASREQLLGAGARPRGDADARGHRQLASSADAANGVRSASWQALGDQLGARASSEASSAITTNSSPPSRPSASVSRTRPSRRAATARSSSSPAPWPSVSLMRREVVEVRRAARRPGVWRRARLEHLLGAVEDQRAVGQARERVVRGHERELLAAARRAPPRRGRAPARRPRTSARASRRASPGSSPARGAARGRRRLSRGAPRAARRRRASRQRRQRLVTSSSGAARWAASWPNSSKASCAAPIPSSGRPPAIQSATVTVAIVQIRSRRSSTCGSSAPAASVVRWETSSRHARRVLAQRGSEQARTSCSTCALSVFFGCGHGSRHPPHDAELIHHLARSVGQSRTALESWLRGLEHGAETRSRFESVLRRCLGAALNARGPASSAPRGRRRGARGRPRDRSPSHARARRGRRSCARPSASAARRGRVSTPRARASPQDPSPRCPGALARRADASRIERCSRAREPGAPGARGRRRQRLGPARCVMAAASSPSARLAGSTATSRSMRSSSGPLRRPCASARSRSAQRQPSPPSQPHGLVAHTSMKRAGPWRRWARAIATRPSSSGWRSASSAARENSDSSSRNSTPLCASATSPTQPLPAAADQAGGGDRVVGRAERAAGARGVRTRGGPRRSWMRATSIASARLSGGRIEGRRWASIVLPVPGGPLSSSCARRPRRSRSARRRRCGRARRRGRRALCAARVPPRGAGGGAGRRARRRQARARRSRALARRRRSSPSTSAAARSPGCEREAAAAPQRRGWPRRPRACRELAGRCRRGQLAEQRVAARAARRASARWRRAPRRRARGRAPGRPWAGRRARGWR